MTAQDFSWIAEISTLELEFEKVGTLRKDLRYDLLMTSADGKSTERHVVDVPRGERVFGSTTECSDGPPIVFLETADGRKAHLSMDDSRMYVAWEEEKGCCPKPSELGSVLALHRRWLETRGVSGERAHLRRLYLGEWAPPVAGLQGICLQESTIGGARLAGADLSWAWLRDVQLEGADLRGADLAHADLRRTMFIRADLRDARLPLEMDSSSDNMFDEANLQGIVWKNARLSDMKLQGAQLQRADLGGTSLIGANLRGADLTGANLRGADLTEAELGQADLRDADLSGAILRDADLRESSNLTAAQLTAAQDWQDSLRDPALACGASLPKRFDAFGTFGDLVNGKPVDPVHIEKLKASGIFSLEDIEELLASNPAPRSNG